MRNRRRIETHEKPMISYIIFARHDAMSIVDMIEREFGLSPAKKYFESLDTNHICDFETENSKLISEFIGKTESQRLSYFRKITKDSDDKSKILFLVLALLGVLRAGEVAELRDRFRYSLVPGLGNRVTISNLYSFVDEVTGLFDYSWPYELISAMGVHNDEDEF